MGLVGLVISLSLLVLTSAMLARRWGRTTAERFWLAAAAGMLEIGAGVTILSLAKAVTPIALLVFQFVVTAGVWLITKGQAKASRRPGRFNRSEKLLLGAIVAMILLTGLEQVFLPVSNIDDRNYRASRAAYWLQGRTILAPKSHNDRQVAFPPGGSLPFFYGILFTRNEAAGLLMTWSAYPLAATGMYFLLRSVRLTRTSSLLATLVFCFTPIVLLSTRGVQPELWLTLCTLGCAFWSARALRRRRCAFATAMACLFAVLAINVRATALPLLLVVLALTMLRPRRLVAAAVGGVVAVMCSGLLLIILVNLHRFDHPLGSKTFRNIHSADTSLNQIRAHAARTVVVLLEPPFVPEPLRPKLQHAADAALHALRGDLLLPREDQPWPGKFRPEVRRWAEKFSLPGVLWMPVLVIACCAAVRAVLRRRLRSLDVVTLLAVAFFLAVVLVVRWMGGMGRFWVAPYALAVVVSAVLLTAASRRRRWIAIASAALIAVTAVPAAIHRATMLRDVAEPQPEVALDEPYAEPLLHIPPGSTIVLAAGQGTRDYPLFRPRDGFSNRVISRGKPPFNFFDLDHASHVIIEDDRRLDYGWDPSWEMLPVAYSMQRRGDFREIPLRYTPHMRLFARTSPPR